ncbi:hypothetical protein [Pantoea wallisii]|uniref:hypothetical protein n=1 Tax=Pantoea wallisii TaxID=1076551 RepID=UPI001301BB2C|nr:hypothetical protein [Pantoea wallisii]
MMKKILQQWFSRLTATRGAPAGQPEYDLSKHIDLLIPVSQLYGIEFHPSVWRYYDR